MTGKEFTVRSKYLIGADGGNSKVAEDAGLSFEGRMGVAGSMNILFEADLSRYVAHRPSVLYWVLQPGADVGGIGMGLVRMVRPWNEWLIVWGYDINQPAPAVDEAHAKKVVRDLVGVQDLDVTIKQVSTWTVNNMYATTMSNRRVFCMGDAAHRHPPSNGLGSNTSIQDAFNLAWKLAFVLKGQAGETLLDTYTAERAPVAKQIVTRANKSIEEFGPIFKALGLLDSIDPVKMQQNMDGRCRDTPAAEEQRASIRKAIAAKVYEFDAHGVEMNQRYRSDAIVTDGQPEPVFTKDPELHFQQTTWPGPGFRMPGSFRMTARRPRRSISPATAGSPCSPGSADRAGLKRRRSSATSLVSILRPTSSARGSIGMISPATGPHSAKCVTAASFSCVLTIMSAGARKGCRQIPSQTFAGS